MELDSKVQAKEDTSKERKKVKEFIIDETLLKAGSQYAWLWIAIEQLNKMILRIQISFERTILVAEQFLNSLANTYGKCDVSTDGEGTWYIHHMLVNF